MDIKKTGSIDTNKIKMLVYGSAGIGKTVFCSTAPNSLILDAEGGLMSVKDKNVDFIEIKEFSVMKEIYAKLLTGELKYDTIIVDSLTEVSKRSMDSIVGTKNRASDIANQHDWLENIEQVRRLVRCYRDLPYNVIFTCLARDEKSEISGGVTRKPTVSAKSLSDEIVGYLDIVCYMEMDSEGKRWLCTQPHTTKQGYEVYAKDRSGKLDKFEEPNFVKVLDKVYSKPFEKIAESVMAEKDLKEEVKDKKKGGK